jgi:beta-galactosidase
MEELGQAYGYLLYRAYLSKSGGGELVVDQVHSYAVVYLDGKQVGTLDRRLNQDRLTLPATASNSRLDILVENTGRVNYGPLIPGEHAGITHQVSFNGAPVIGWEMFPMPLDNVERMHFSATPCEGPCFRKGTFDVTKPADTFLDTTAFTKGDLWINGKMLGRIWNIGPQKTLYLPQPWMHPGGNEVVVFDLFGKSARGTIAGLDHPVFTEPVK